MTDYPIVLDTWEGNEGLDLSILRAAGLAGRIHRINDMGGGHHPDQTFSADWQAGAQWLRAVYFVYNPWVSGKDNYDWLMAYLPADSPRRVCVDIEVRKADYSPIEYAANVQGFLNLLARAYWPAIYTGAWFLPYLSTWPKAEYWWARYPYAFYPPVSVALTWEELKAKVNALPWLPGCTTGTCRLWQCTADRYKLPGCNGRCVDINIWNGSPDELRQWIGAPEERHVWAVEIDRWARTLGYQGVGPE